MELNSIFYHSKEFELFKEKVVQKTRMLQIDFNNLMYLVLRDKIYILSLKSLSKGKNYIKSKIMVYKLY
jgi:hypothetical protein